MIALLLRLRLLHRRSTRFDVSIYSLAPRLLFCKYRPPPYAEVESARAGDGKKTEGGGAGEDGAGSGGGHWCGLEGEGGGWVLGSWGMLMDGVEFAGVDVMAWARVAVVGGG